METNCSKRVLEGELVYAWNGTDLVLLPCDSDEYKKAMEYTDRQDMKVSAKELKAGCSYTTKKGEEVIYVGKYNWFSWEKYGEGRIMKKAHIFAHPKKPEYGELFFPKDGVSFLASCNNPDPVENFAELVDKFNGTINSSVITAWESKPAKVNLEIVEGKVHYGGPKMRRENYAKMNGDRIDFYVAQVVSEQNYNNKTNTYEYVTKGFRLEKEGSIDTKNCKKTREGHYYGYSYYNNWHSHDRNGIITEQKLLEKLTDMVDIYMVLESGKKLRVKSLSDYGG